jgi:hypothetical protein
MSAVQHWESAFGPPLPWAENRVWVSNVQNHTFIGLSSAANSTSRWSSWQIYDRTASDRLVGLDYFGARYMSSAHGRFTGTDPKQRQPTIVPHKSLPIRVAGHNDLKFSYI